jgi:two-component sensor histidine kinase
VEVELQREDDRLRVSVRDNGVGLPPDFTIDSTSSLGLSIVRGLVGTQLGGTISMRTEGGTVVELDIPVEATSEDLASL